MCVAHQRVPDYVKWHAVLQSQRGDHRGIACDLGEIRAALAAVDEHFARRAVGIKTNADGEVLIPKPQVKGFAGAALRKGSPDHRRHDMRLRSRPWGHVVLG